MTSALAEKVADKICLEGDQKAKTIDVILRMYELFVKKDALLIEINPYAEDTSGNCKLKIKTSFKFKFIIIDCEIERITEIGN